MNMEGSGDSVTDNSKQTEFITMITQENPPQAGSEEITAVSETPSETPSEQAISTLDYVQAPDPIATDQAMQVEITAVSETPSEERDSTLDHVQTDSSISNLMANSDVTANADHHGRLVTGSKSEHGIYSETKSVESCTGSGIGPSESDSNAVNAPIATSEIKPEQVQSRTTNEHDNKVCPPNYTPEQTGDKHEIKQPLECLEGVSTEKEIVSRDCSVGHSISDSMCTTDVHSSAANVLPAECDQMSSQPENKAKVSQSQHGQTAAKGSSPDMIVEDNFTNVQPFSCAVLEEKALSETSLQNSGQVTMVTEPTDTENQSKSLFSNESSSAEACLSEPVCKQRKLEQPLECSQERAVDTEMPASTESVGDTMLYNFKHAPKQITGAWSCFETHDQGNYLRGCKWAPDGTCILTASNDNCLRLFNLPQELYYDGGENKDIPELVPVVKMKEADTIYDYCWYPKMTSQDPDTACLAVTSKETPIHMFDAFTGEVRCSYRPHNQVDELAAAYSISFNPDGQKLYCGFNKMIRVFDVNRPGKDCESRPTYAKEGQPGIISCISHSPTEPGVYAAGSYARGIAIYTEPSGEMVCMFLGQQGGVTQLMFSADGYRLYSGGRKDPEIICWDMRNPGQILYTMLREVETNQRIYFDQTSDGRYIVSGSHDGTVRIWDMQKQPVMVQADSDPLLQPILMYNAHRDTVNGVSFHPLLPVIASSSGQRHFPSLAYSDSESDQEHTDTIDNSLRLWWV